MMHYNHLEFIRIFSLVFAVIFSLYIIYSVFRFRYLNTPSMRYFTLMCAGAAGASLGVTVLTRLPPARWSGELANPVYIFFIGIAYYYYFRLIGEYLGIHSRTYDRVSHSFMALALVIMALWLHHYVTGSELFIIEDNEKIINLFSLAIGRRYLKPSNLALLLVYLPFLFCLIFLLVSIFTRLVKRAAKEKLLFAGLLLTFTIAFFELAHNSFQITVTYEFPLAFIGFFFEAVRFNQIHDYTFHELVAARKQLEKTSRLAEISLTAGSITHDIRNSMQVLRNGLIILQQDSPPPDDETLRAELSSLYTGMGDEISRVNTIIQSYTSLMQDGGKMKKEVCSLASILEDAVELSAPDMAAHDIALPRIPPAGRLQIKCRHQEIVLAVTNLLKNAAHAAGSRSEKKDRWVRLALTVTDQSVRLEVLDSGRGIPAALESEIFDARFTTRRDAGGSGMGLFIVKKIVESHGFGISYNRLENHTCFSLTMQPES